MTDKIVSVIDVNILALKVKHSGCAHKYFRKNQSIMKKREVSLIRITFQFLISRDRRREHLERVT